MSADKNNIDLYSMNAAEIYEWFIAANLPCFDLIIYDEDSDPNHQLNRPGCYTSKVNFNDVHYAADDNPFTIEAFENVQDALARKTYVDRIIHENPGLGLNQYIYLKGNALIRLPYKLSPRFAKKYEEVLDDLLMQIDVTGKFEKEDMSNPNFEEKTPAAQTKTTYTITFGDKAETEDTTQNNTVIEPKTDIPALTDEYALEELRYFAPQGWLFSQTQRGSYHYAKELQSIEGGYMYCLGIPLDSDTAAHVKENPYKALDEIIEGMLSSSAINKVVGEKTKIRSDNKNGLIYFSEVNAANAARLCGNMLLAGDKFVYSFTFLMPEYSQDQYTRLLHAFILKIEANIAQSSLADKLASLKSDLDKK